MCVTFGDFEGETATSNGYILDCSIFHSPSPELASELLWPGQKQTPRLSSSLLVYHLRNASIHISLEKCHQAVGVSTPSFHRNIVVQGGS